MEHNPGGDIWGDIKKQHELNTHPPIEEQSSHVPDAAFGPVKVCSGCGSPVIPGAGFCHNCGAGLLRNTMPDKKICTGCGSQNKLSSQYCYKCGLSLRQSTVQVQDVKYGGFWARVGAYFIDGFILSVMSTILYIPWFVWMFNQIESAAYTYSEDTTAMDNTITTWFVVTAGVVFAAVVLYNVITVGKWGKTFGKMAMGLKIVKSDGSRVGYARALGRYLAYLLNGVTLCLSFLIIAFTPKKRGIHDFVAGTIVIKTR